MMSRPVATPTAARSRQPLAASLRELGFSDYEARAYAALAARQPATAYEIAKVTGLPRAVYCLCDLSLVANPVDGRPRERAQGSAGERVRNTVPCLPGRRCPSPPY